MTKSLTIILTLLTVATVFGQTSSMSQKVTVTKYSKTVPTGKKWILASETKIKVQVNKGVFESGSMCNAMFLSNPNMIMTINRGDIYNSEGYGIVFKNSEKVSNTNNFTYELHSISFVDKTFSVYDFQNKTPEEVGVNKLIFKSGESVFVGNCLESVEMVEVTMTSQELLEENKKQAETEKLELVKANNFNIPISPEKRVEPGTKPVLKDSLIEYVVFASSAVLVQQKNQRASIDESQWTITLTHAQLELISSINGKVLGSMRYTVLDAKPCDRGVCQEFQLADESGQFSHRLYIDYSNSRQSYSVIVNSLDFKDSFQFQKVTLKEIKYQEK